MSSTPDTPVNDWTAMRRADFDERAPAPTALVEVDAVSRPVPAAPDAYGTEPLFGVEPAPRRAARPVKAPVPPADTLF